MTFSVFNIFRLSFKLFLFFLNETVSTPFCTKYRFFAPLSCKYLHDALEIPILISADFIISLPMVMSINIRNCIHQ